MRAPPPRLQPGGSADDRLPPRRPASAPPAADATLVDHLAERLADVELTLRDAHARSDRLEAERAALDRAITALLGAGEPELQHVMRAGLPLLGDWCLVEESVGSHVARTFAATEGSCEVAAAALAGGPDGRPGDSVLLERLRVNGRIERLAQLPWLPTGDDPVAHALEALGDGPVLLVPVLVHGRLCAGVAFGRTSCDAAEYDTADERLAAAFAQLLALAIERRRVVAEAGEAARAKAEFLTVMSHELRTPLNAIGGYAQLLEMGFRGPLTDDQLEAVQRIIRGQEHLLELVDSVLTFSRLTSGRLLIDRAELAADALLDLAVDPMRRDFEARQVALEVVPCGTEARVAADHERAPQVLRHLLSNALKFTAPGGRVEIACGCTDGDVRFTVTDTGCGIPASQREAIFQPFVQVDKGHARSAEGSGLGLAIGRELAERMGGSLVVTSEVGVGSRFVLSLPRAGREPAAGSIDTTGGQG